MVFEIDDAPPISIGNIRTFPFPESAESNCPTFRNAEEGRQVEVKISVPIDATYPGNAAIGKQYKDKAKMIRDTPIKFNEVFVR